eukprot:NODE_647_length_2015_cov_24.268566_g598_i0.p1 GENE.NODE_647_length_2015_cov_24.268566_g598_i0~~NODE_647_length_2015_cov_24.268566_g598_i0.p1  ORF type:complete len:319 (-),score=49.65 NODE_647_length_2015_cov_24.268566_g598_i0:1058-1960(-)
MLRTLFALIFGLFWPCSCVIDSPMFDPTSAPNVTGAHCASIRKSDLRTYLVARSGSAPRIFDLFVFDHELDMLEIRLNELWSVVDFFVLVESNLTFTGLPKLLLFEVNKGRFRKFLSKIVHVVIPAQQLMHPWTLLSHQEDHVRKSIARQRDSASRDYGLTIGLASAGATDSDLVLTSDIDEIPAPSALAQLQLCAGWNVARLAVVLYQYSFEFRSTLRWLHGTRLTSVANARSLGGFRLRYDPEPLDLDYIGAHLGLRGWHCSSCFATMKDFLNKIQNIFHTEMNQPKLKKPSYMITTV